MKVDKQPFQINDKITTDFFKGRESVVRTVSSCVQNKHSSSGWIITTMETSCPCCGRSEDQLYGVDSAWAKKVEPT